MGASPPLPSEIFRRGGSEVINDGTFDDPASAAEVDANGADEAAAAADEDDGGGDLLSSRLGGEVDPRRLLGEVKHLK